MDEPRTSRERWGDGWYVPDEGLVRATVDATCCLTEPMPRGAAELLHLIGCATCQSFVDSAAVTERWSASQFIPSDTVVAAVVARSATPRFRFPWDDLRATSARERRPAKAAAAFLIALGLSPSVLSAAVLAHAAALISAGVWLAASIHSSSGAPNTRLASSSRLVEHVAYVALREPDEQYASRSRSDSIRGGEMSELAVAFRQSIRVAAGRPPRFSIDDERHLARTAVTLRQLAWASVRVETDSTAEALRTAEEVSGYLGRRGVDAKRRRIVVHPGLANVEVVLEQVSTPSRTIEP
ncbi:MAG: hypothetical protein ACJ79A_20875 [Gemmatimonadaceae bacterium]